jgi:hypothetical protein
MTENTNFFNEITLIEELESKIAPSGIWDELSINPNFR